MGCAEPQGVLGSRVASKQQSSDTATLDAIKALAQKLPPSERSSLNALLAAALKQGDSSGAATAPEVFFRSRPCCSPAIDGLQHVDRQRESDISVCAAQS